MYLLFCDITDEKFSLQFLNFSQIFQETGKRKVCLLQIQLINWAIPENIRTIPRTASIF